MVPLLLRWENPSSEGATASLFHMGAVDGSDLPKIGTRLNYFATPGLSAVVKVRPEDVT
jgi:hypothetical protein